MMQRQAPRVCGQPRQQLLWLVVATVVFLLCLVLRQTSSPVEQGQPATEVQPARSASFKADDAHSVDAHQFVLNLDDEQQSAGGSAANEDAVDAAHAAAQSWSRAKASQTQLDKLSSDRLSATASTASGQPRKVQPGRKEDLLIVMPSNIDRMPIVAASRGWRQGVKTYVTFEQEIDLANSSSLFQEGAKYNEIYGLCPDQVVSDSRWHKAGDLRATVTPFLANMTVGPDNFKWMLFGDDDTVFLIDNVLNLIPHLDPTLPYFLTDHLWYPQISGGRQLFVHANREALRCLPCNYTDPAEQSFQNPSGQYNAPRGCPCTTEALCKADTAGKFRSDCSWNSNTPGFWYFGHGGAGMLMSSALFKQGSYSDVVEWIWSLGDISSGDSMLAGAVHTVLGIIPTDPGYSYFRPNMRLFDPGWHGLQVKGEEDENTGDNGNDPLGVLARIESALQGQCSFECEDQLQHVLSIHLRTRYLAAELSQDEIAHNEPDYEGSPDHRPAVFLHHKIDKMWQQYSSLRPDRSWFDVQAAATADSQY